jgi:hypothetical protein
LCLLTRRFHLACYALTACVPVVSAALALTIDVDPYRWLAMPTPPVRMVTAHAIMIETALAGLLAPIAGVALFAHGLRGWPLGRLIVTATLTLVALSTLIVLVAGGRTALPLVAMSHATLGAAVIALAALGAALASRVGDPLDAAGLGVCLAACLAIGVLVAGPRVGDLPTPVVNASLLASPLVATAASVNFDILRSDILAHLSPIAHRRFDYPTWYASSLVYLGAALLLLAGTSRE